MKSCFIIGAENGIFPFMLHAINRLYVCWCVCVSDIGDSAIVVNVNVEMWNCSNEETMQLLGEQTIGSN